MARPSITVAAAQLPAHPLADAEAAWQDIVRAADQAGQRQVDLLVLPECAYPAYGIYSLDEYRAARLRPNDRLRAELAALAHRGRFCLVAGVVEQAEDRLYNAAWVFDRRGRYLGCYRKNFLWDHDHAVFEPGDAVEPFETEFGRIGVLICADGRAPENSATLASRGAQLVAVASNWVNLASQPGAYWNPQPEILIPARAMEFRQPHVCANKFGQESDRLRFCGQSCLVGSDGGVVASAPPDREALLVCRLKLGRPRPADVPQAWRQTLLTPQSPRLVPPRAPGPLRVAVIPGRVARAQDDFDRWLAREQAAGTRILITRAPDVVTAYRWQWAGMRRGVDLLAGCHQPLVISLADATIGLLPGRASAGFAGPRVLALAGAELVVVFDPPAAQTIWRARAAENRIFLATCGAASAGLIDPRGQVLAEQGPDPDAILAADLDLAEAHFKQVAPQTDVFAERRVQLYHF